jgi:hypothetical protein
MNCVNEFYDFTKSDILSDDVTFLLCKFLKDKETSWSHEMMRYLDIRNIRLGKEKKST